MVGAAGVNVHLLIDVVFQAHWSRAYGRRKNGGGDDRSRDGRVVGGDDGASVDSEVKRTVM